MNHEHPLLLQMRELERSSRTGSFTLAHDRSLVRVYFRNGRIGAASADLPEHRLGEYLVSGGIVDRAALGKLLKRAARGRSPLGETALRMGIVDSSELRELLCRQACEVLGRSLSNGFEPGAFEPAAPDAGVSAQLDVDSLLLELARQDASPPPPQPGVRFALKRGKRPSDLPWLPEEAFLLMRLQAGCTVEQAAAETGFEEVAVRRMLELFRRFDLVDAFDGEAPAAAEAAVESGDALELFVPTIAAGDSALKLEVLRNAPSFVSEQFRSLKTSLRELQAARSTQVLGVSSACMQDGKSLVSVNLALTLARDESRRVALLDCDFRNPSVQRYCEIPLAPGILGWMESSRIPPLCYLRRLGRLFVMTAGGVAENPVEALSHPNMERLLEDLRKRFDTIVIDSPPLEPVSDARIISSLADGMLLVVRSGRTPFASIEKAIKQIDRKKLLGAVFNDVVPMRLHTYYDHRYYGKYGGYPSYGRHRRSPYLGRQLPNQPH